MPDIFNHTGLGATHNSPAGRHNEGHRFNNRKRFNDISDMFMHWVRKRLPTPGAQNYAYETLELAEFDPVGPGYGPRRILYKLQGPQSYVPINAVPTNGLGGVVAGQMVLQPLYDPNTNTYAGVPLS